MRCDTKCNNCGACLVESFDGSGGMTCPRCRSEYGGDD